MNSEPETTGGILAMPSASPDRPRNLYVHVPFCGRKCDYCAFYSETGSRELMARYVGALNREMEAIAPFITHPPTTLFFGGGTPSLLPVPLWEKLIGQARLIGLAPAEEWTVECNPATLSWEKARYLRDQGVNRISLGVQALDDDLLDRLGRIHSRQAVFDSYDLLRRAGFDNINLDLMFAIPGQSMALWKQTLNQALALQPEHLACYELIYEEDTPLTLQLAAGAVRPDEDLAAAMFELLLDRTAEHGLIQYQIANFARHTGSGSSGIPDRACRHNINYWRGGPFLGLGPSASSFVQGMRFQNCANTERYCARLENGERPIESQDPLNPLARAGEIAAFGLRMNRGWGFDEFIEATNFDLRGPWADDMAELVEHNLAHWDAGGFRLSARGMRFADAAAQAFLR